MIFEKIIRYLKALKNAKKYDNILCLGYNCEIAYRFYKNYKFVDSSLYGWTYTTFKQLKDTLTNPDKLGTGTFTYNINSHTITCNNTGIVFHGRSSAADFTGDEEKDNERMNADKEELRSRLAYLKDKFVKTASDGKKNLYIRKVHPSDGGENYADAKEEVMWIFNYLKSFCKNDFTLLLVTEKRFYDKYLFDNPQIETRYVEKYSADACVTAKKEGDAFGWKVIFKEFQPKTIKKQKGKLKFEVNE